MAQIFFDIGGNRPEQQKKYLNEIHIKIFNIKFEVDFIVRDSNCDDWWSNNKDSSYFKEAINNITKGMYQELIKLDGKVLTAVASIESGDEGKIAYSKTPLLSSNIDFKTIKSNKRIVCDTQSISGHGDTIIRRCSNIEDYVDDIKDLEKKLIKEISQFGCSKQTIRDCCSNIYKYSGRLKNVGKVLKQIATCYTDANKKLKYVIDKIASGQIKYSDYGNAEDAWNSLNKAWKNKKKSDNSIFNKAKRSVNGVKKFYSKFYKENVWYQVAWETVGDTLNIGKGIGSFLGHMATGDIGGALNDLYSIGNTVTATGYDVGALLGCAIQNATGVDLSEEIKKAREVESIKEHYEYYDIDKSNPYLYTAVEGLDIVNKGYDLYDTTKTIGKNADALLHSNDKNKLIKLLNITDEKQIKEYSELPVGDLKKKIVVNTVFGIKNKGSLIGNAMDFSNLKGVYKSGKNIANNNYGKIVSDVLLKPHSIYSKTDTLVESLMELGNKRK